MASGGDNLWQWSSEGLAAASRVLPLLGLHVPQLPRLGSALSPATSRQSFYGAVPCSGQGSWVDLLELGGQSCSCHWLHTPAP